MRFDSQVLLVTGGASGIGRATAERVTAEGGRAAIVDLDGDRAAAVAQEIPGAIGIGADVADPDSVDRAVAETVKRLGGIDLVLAAAGHAEFGPLEEWDTARFNRMLEVHVTGTFHVCKAVRPSMVARGGGSIVAIASIAALLAQKQNVPYGAAKAAIAGFARQYSLEVVGDGIRVNCVAPGRVITGMTEPIMVARGGDLEKGAEIFGQANPMKRMAVAAELAAPVCFLLSTDASFITGATLVVDGGESIV